MSSLKLLSGPDSRSKFYSYSWFTKAAGSTTIQETTNPRLQLKLITDESEPDQPLSASSRAPEDSIHPSVYLTLLSGAASVKIFYSVSGTGIRHYFYSGSGIVPDLQKGKTERLSLTKHYLPSKPIYSKYLSFDVYFAIMEETPLIPPPQASLLDDLKATFFDGSACDAVNVIAGEYRFSASKYMLSTRSPVFKAMLRADMKEKAYSTVNCPNLHPDVCKEMLSYIHTDETPNISAITGMAEALWLAARCCQLPGLQAKCESHLINQVTVENAAKLLAFANSYVGKSSALRKHVMSFVTQDTTTCDKVIASEGWAEVATQPELVSEVLAGVVKQKNK